MSLLAFVPTEYHWRPSAWVEGEWYRSDAIALPQRLPGLVKYAINV